MRPTFAEINLSNLKFNYLNIRRKVRNSKVMAVIKADAYGHGMIEFAKALNKLGNNKPEYFAVAIIEEATELAKLNTEQSILVFAPLAKSNCPEKLNKKIIPTVFTKEHMKILLSYYKGKPIKVHVKIDTGMGRVGVKYDEAVKFIEYVNSLKEFSIDGIYTHFATSDEKDKTYANLQLERFKNIIAALKSKNIKYGVAHCANSGAILDMPDSYLDMVRPGIALYGYYPSHDTTESIKLKPVMSLYSVVDNVKQISKGESVSYGRRFIAKQKTFIASCSIGYADGFIRALTNKTFGIIGNKKFKQVGQVCMDRIMFEVNGKVKPGDKIILLGQKGKLKINAWDWSDIVNTIPYEVTCNISKRVPRKYIE